MQQIQQIENFQIKNCAKDKQEKVASRIKFLRLVLCDNKTIRVSAQICKINFSTAKAILNKFRKQGVIKQSYQDYDGQIDLLKQIVQIQKGIRCEQISKSLESKQKLNNQLQFFLQNIQIQRKSINQELDKKALEEELMCEKQKEYMLVEQILKEQIILMKKRCH
ncbi:unnamed protein product [Paramecium pentaurelia]|uniref:Uncharacterized protein n=1 Tax=Paramecium pentaurelia TaxID=43138 RepID=A0A8S1WKU8_9CILI|nr:unnamed protein product [Paramecium pentaurelia]